MRIAFFSPLPPARSGIADYAEALLKPLGERAEVTTFTELPESFDAAEFDVCLYQLGNNPYHIFAYQAALKHPGVVVLHEANLHHLIADATIKNGDWDGYLAEVEADGGARELSYVLRWVRPLKRGPNYDLPLLKTVLSRSRGVIVHSDAVAKVAASRGYKGPLARIWHGAWTFPEDEIARDREAYRKKLGIGAEAPLFGIFGFLKPYKRIAESLRAFKRLLDLVPEARLILVGEAHPDFPLQRLVSSLGLSGAVRHIDYAPIEDFNGYLAACDAIVNLRHPTVGETSGTLLRGLSMGKPVLVSDLGAFSEYPDEICLKTPIDASEEEHIFEYLRLLATRPEVGEALGRNAREWVRRKCNWDLVAERYVAFLNSVVSGKAATGDEAQVGATEERQDAEGAAAVAAANVVNAEASLAQPTAAPSSVSSAPASTAAVAAHRAEILDRAQVAMVDGSMAQEFAAEPLSELAEYILTWTRPEDGSRGYAETHLTRLEHTLEITPPGGPEDRILEMGAYLQITPALKTKLGYGEVRGCYYGPAGKVDHREATSTTGETFACEVDLFDAEKDPFPYPDEHFATVLCCELIEHLPNDPVFMMQEINRVLRPGGHLVVTTPNIASLRALHGILQGYHPMLFSDYIRPNPKGEVDPRHAREYAPNELHRLFEDCGFEVTLVETGAFREGPNVAYRWVEHLLDQYLLTQGHRGEGIYIVGRKVGPVRERYPSWLYS